MCLVESNPLVGHGLTETDFAKGQFLDSNKHRPAIMLLNMSNIELQHCMGSFTPEHILSFTLNTHHEVTLCQTLQRDGHEDPGFMAALLGYLRALPRQLPMLGGAQVGGNYLASREQTRLSTHA